MTTTNQPSAPAGGDEDFDEQYYLNEAIKLSMTEPEPGAAGG